MLSGQPSRTLLGSAIRRGQHQLLDRPLILDDPVVLKLVPEAADPRALPEMGGPQEAVPTLLRALMAMRARFTEDRLMKAAQRGARQYVIIGAGLDTFPWRQPAFAQAMTIFAADHPESLVWTQRRLRQCELTRPANLAHVPIDLENADIGVQLEACGFDRSLVSFCSVLGVIHYLEIGAVEALLTFAASLMPGSEIVLSVLTLDEDLSGQDLEASIQGVAVTNGLSEPWKFRQRPAVFVDRLRRKGFSSAFHLTPEVAQELYFFDRQDNLRAPRWEQLIVAMV
jgi:methyltransferase (TIGR00027 family)